MKELEYPFDNGFIMKKKRSLKRQLLGDGAVRLKKRVAVLGGSTTDVVLMASGSEVSLAVDAARLLAQQSIQARVLSIPDVTTFMAQPPQYRQELLPAGVPRVALEAGRSESFGRLLGDTGLFIGWEQFGASAPAEVLAEKFGLTTDQVVASVRRFIGKDA
jgi:transketolase